MILRPVAVVLTLAASVFAGQDRFVVRTTPSAVENVARAAGLVNLGHVDAGRHVYLLQAPSASSGASVLSTLRSHPSVDAAEADVRVTLPAPHLDQSTVAILDGARAPASQSNRTAAYLHQPATGIINLDSAQRMATGAGIVAIIDTGVDATHPLLKDSVIAGFDFIHGTPGDASDVADLEQSTVAILDQSTVAILDQSTVAILDQSTVAILDQSTVAILDGKLPPAFGHGTMVAGLVHLVAPTAKIMPLRVFTTDGSASLADIVKAVYYAADAGAKVINMSFSMDAPSQELKKAIGYATSKGCVLISSVANAASSADVYPAALDRVLGIASTNNYDVRSSFSNYGEDVSLAAPGEALLTTFPFNRYAVAWGTSFSTAIVSGTTSLVTQLDPKANQSKVAEALSHAVPVTSPGLGWGRLDASWALTGLSSDDEGEDEE